MKNKILFTLVIILSFGALKSSFDQKDKTIFFNDLEVNVLNELQEIENINLEEYVIGVVAAEMPASFHEEALKAQAVAARTYALYKIKNSKEKYDLVTDVSDQAYINKDKMREKWFNEYEYYYNKIKQAVQQTKGEVIKYNNEIICSFYFSMSNGYTEESSLVFGEHQDYLKTVDSPWDKEVHNFEVTVNLEKADFCQKLNIECNKIDIQAINRSHTNRVNEIKINNKKFKGTEFRQILGLRSTDFDINIDEKVIISTKGYGHGVGMSQYGANKMAQEGKTYHEILKYYYQNINIEKYNV